MKVLKISFVCLAALMISGKLFAQTTQQVKNDTAKVSKAQPGAVPANTLSKNYQMHLEKISLPAANAKKNTATQENATNTAAQGQQHKLDLRNLKPVPAGTNTKDSKTAN